MKNPARNLIFFTVLLFCACAQVQNLTLMSEEPPVKGSEPTVEEVYTWFPPSQEKLQARKLRQQHLDSIEVEVSQLYLNHENNIKLANRFEDRVDPWAPAISNWESRVQQEIVLQEKRGESAGRILDSVKKEMAVVDQKLEDFKKVPPKSGFSYNDYVVAVGFFRDGKYKESIDTFKKVLAQRPPLALMDNIHFAISSSYYHLKEYKKTVFHLDKIIKKYPEGDKWHMSYVMLGLAYNALGQKSQAIYGLEEVLKKNPPTQIIKLVNRLRKLIDVEPAES